MSSNVAKSVHPMFADAQLKAEWAAHNINNLNALHAAYARNCIRSSIANVHGFKQGYNVFVIADEMTVPTGLLVGDIIRNLRGALEHVIAAMCRAIPKREDLMYFPIGTDRQSYRGTIKGGIERYWPALAPLFLDDIDATEASNSPIWTLNQIDRSNKHRAITIVNEVTATPLPDWSTQSGSTFSGNILGVKPGHSDYWFIPPNVDIKDYTNTKFALHVTFGPTEILSGQHVGPTLINFYKVVTETIAKISEAYVVAYL